MIYPDTITPISKGTRFRAVYPSVGNVTVTAFSDGDVILGATDWEGGVPHLDVSAIPLLIDTLNAARDWAHHMEGECSHA